MNLIELAEESFRKYGEYEAVYFEGKTYTNKERELEGRKLAHSLQNLGIKKGDRVMVIMSNCPEVIISYLAILKLCAIIVPVLFLYSEEEIAYILKDAGVRLIITENTFLQKIEQAIEMSKLPVKIISLGEVEKENVYSYENLIKKNPDKEIKEKIKDNDIAVFIYTSGTTGKPKGCMLNHHALYKNALIVSEAGVVKEGEVGLLALPLAHIYGIVVMNVGLIYGTSGVLMRWFDAGQALKFIQDFKIESFAGVPTMYTYLIQHPDRKKYDTSSLKKCGCAAAPLSIELLKEFEKEFPSAKVYEGYGLTESAGGLAANRPNIKRKLGSVGIALPEMEIKIFDDNDKELPPNEIGEIVAKGPSIMTGYHNRPKETKETLKGGWLHTGDMGYLDEEGYLYVTERKKDLIIRGGINIYPKQIEEVLFSHPKISDCAVVGMPDENFGEEVKAFVVLKLGEKLTEEEIIEFCQKHLGKFKCPKKVEFKSYLPKNILGKVLKRELRNGKK
jgi:long-chain acyl-CoA synthetase